MAELLIRTPQGTERRLPLATPRLTLGRSPRADVMLDDPFASRLHAELRLDNDACWFQDLGSANGSRLNEVLIDHGPVRVETGDVIRIGATRLEIVFDSRNVTSGASGTRFLPRPPRDAGERSGQDLESVLLTVARATSPADTPTSLPQRSPDDAAELLEVIGKVGVALLSPASLDEVLQQILDLVFERLPAQRAFLLLTQDGEPVLTAGRTAEGPLDTSPAALGISSLIREEVLGNGRSVLTSDAQQDERFRDRESVILSGVRSVMTVPLATASGVLGMIYTDNPIRVRIFTDDDLRLLTVIASVAAIKVENTLLVEDHIETERLRQQIDSARAIQSRLLPGRPPDVDGYELAGVSFPCFEVGGDYFDFVSLEDGSLVLGLGDVSGKGLDAAILMSSLHAAIRAQAETGLDVADMVRRVNRYLFESTPYNKFATLVCGRLQPAEHVVHYVNCGHNPPIVVRADGRCEELPASAPPVGLVAAIEPVLCRVELAPGELILLYSDGLSEATDADGDELGAERIQQVLLEHRASAAARIRDRLDEALHRFVGTATPADDLTLVVIKRLAE